MFIFNCITYKTVRVSRLSNGVKSVSSTKSQVENILFIFNILIVLNNAYKILF